MVDNKIEVAAANSYNDKIAKNSRTLSQGTSKTDLSQTKDIGLMLKYRKKDVCPRKLLMIIQIKMIVIMTMIINKNC